MTDNVHKVPLVGDSTSTHDYYGYLMGVSDAFKNGVGTLETLLKSAQSDLAGNPSDPTYLTNYQKILGEYNLYRNAQSTAVKSMKDIDSAIVSNMR